LLPSRLVRPTNAAAAKDAHNTHRMIVDFTAGVIEQDIDAIWPSGCQLYGEVWVLAFDRGIVTECVDTVQGLFVRANIRDGFAFEGFHKLRRQRCQRALRPQKYEWFRRA